MASKGVTVAKGKKKTEPEPVKRLSVREHSVRVRAVPGQDGVVLKDFKTYAEFALNAGPITKGWQQLPPEGLVLNFASRGSGVVFQVSGTAEVPKSGTVPVVASLTVGDNDVDALTDVVFAIIEAKKA